MIQAASVACLESLDEGDRVEIARLIRESSDSLRLLARRARGGEDVEAPCQERGEFSQ